MQIHAKIPDSQMNIACSPILDARETPVINRITATLANIKLIPGNLLLRKILAHRKIFVQ